MAIQEGCPERENREFRLIKECCVEDKKGEKTECRKSYHHGNLREALIRSALDILKEGSLDDLSLRALARRAGVSQTAPYRHFEDKEELIAVLKAEGMVKLGEGMRALTEGEADPLKRLQKCGMNYVRFALEYPAHFKVMFEYELSDYHKYCDLNDVSGTCFKYLQDTVSECLALPDARDINPAVAQFGAWSMVHGLSILLMNESLMDHMKEEHEMDMGEQEQIIEQVNKLFCHSLVK